MFTVLLGSSSNIPEHSVSRIKKSNEHRAYGFIRLCAVTTTEWPELIYVTVIVFTKK